MKKPKRRYTSEEEILNDIRLARQKMHDLLVSAASLATSARNILKGAESSQRGMIWRDPNFMMAEADKLREKATRIEDERIPHLIGKLSEFQTKPLDGIINDSSVEA